MDLSQTLFEIIDMRSFSNLWYWIGLAVLWSSASHWVLGVPNDMVQRARRHGGQAQIDLEDMVRINCNRLLYITNVSGLWLLGFACFFITGLAILGFIYGVEIAQAVFLLAFPMSIVGVLNVSTARLIEQEQAVGDALRSLMTRHRIYVQIIGMIAIFVTALWGMAYNLRDLIFLQ
ncbi:component of SufBCD complex [Pseudosulfitobacter sp. SM2401]|uniref:component of SufBCD complex n=1 Tax=Pseudosulfitobacter sp. SM2401 TaxID=3350098 RepID=UPI0036F44B6D